MTIRFLEEALNIITVSNIGMFLFLQTTYHVSSFASVPIDNDNWLNPFYSVIVEVQGCGDTTQHSCTTGSIVWLKSD